MNKEEKEIEILTQRLRFLELNAIIDIFISLTEDFRFCKCYHDHLLFTTKREAGFGTESVVAYINGRGTSFSEVLERDYLFCECECLGIVRFVGFGHVAKPTHCLHCGAKLK